ncbi:prefoldin subunit alpha [Candidatus Bathyarchaeota archaeon]|nr:prefoldin subunit alpha [Candidatus Bathyarchaeota archaeon]
MSRNEEALRRLLTELRLLEATVEALHNRINLVNAAIAELSFASATIIGLEKEEKGKPLLVPIGGGSFVKAEISTTETMIVGMGAGVSVEKPRDEAKEIIEKRISELEKSRSTIEQQLNQVLERMRSNKQQLNDISVSSAIKQ